MSVVIKKGDNKEEEVSEYLSNLAIMPKLTYVQKQIIKGPVNPIYVWLETEEDFRLPLHWAAKFGIYPRQWTEYRRYRPDSLVFKGKLREEQETIAEPSFQQLVQNGSVILNLPTAFGKTVLGSWLATKIKSLLVAVIYPNTILETQWYKTFTTLTNADVWIVGKPYPSDGFHVVLSTIDGMHSIPKEIRDNVGVLIVDEAHLFLTQRRVHRLLQFSPRFIIALTATLKKENQLHEILFRFCSPETITVENSKEYDVIRVMTRITSEIKMNVDGNADWMSLSKDLAESEERNRLAVEWIQKLVVERHRKVLVLTNLRDHVYYLHKLVKEIGITTEFHCGNKKSYNDAQVLIGSWEKLGVGFDEALACPDFGGVPLNCLLILFSLKTLPLLEQLIGRVFRSQCPLVVEFVDNNPICIRHARERRKLYDDRNIVVEVVEPDGSPVRSRSSTSKRQTKTESPNPDSWVTEKLSQMSKQKNKKDTSSNSWRESNFNQMKNCTPGRSLAQTPQNFDDTLEPSFEIRDTTRQNEDEDDETPNLWVVKKLAQLSSRNSH